MADAHQSLDLERACRELHLLHQRVCQSWGRIEITCKRNHNSTTHDGEQVESCMLISKVELESMERALEILCELPGGREICQEISRVAEQCMDHVLLRPRLPEVPGAILGEEPGTAATA
jgi:hypothetical protein